MVSAPFTLAQAFLDALVGRTADIQLANGGMSSGTLPSWNPKDATLLLRRLADEEPILVAWHAVFTIRRQSVEEEKSREWLAGHEASEGAAEAGRADSWTS